MDASTGGRSAVSLPVLARTVAEARRSLLKTFLDPDRGFSLALDLMSVPAGAETSEQRRFAPIIAQTHARGLQKARLVVADQDMCNLVDSAGPSMPDQVLRLDDPIFPDGLVLWSAPLRDQTGEPPLLPIHLMSWTHIPAQHPILKVGSTNESVLITSYIASADVAVHMNASLRPGTARFIPNATVMWTVGTEIGAAYGRSLEQSGPAPGFYQRALAAFWTIAKQPLAETVEADRPRPADRKRYQRAGVDEPGEPVRLVRLRQRSRRQHDEPSEPTGRTWSVRTYVEPYWRQTWYPSLGVHRQQLVAGSLRGPDGAPMKNAEKVLLASARDVRPRPTGDG